MIEAELKIQMCIITKLIFLFQSVLKHENTHTHTITPNKQNQKGNKRIPTLYILQLKEKKLDWHFIDLPVSQFYLERSLTGRQYISHIPSRVLLPRYHTKQN